MPARLAIPKTISPASPMRRVFSRWRKYIHFILLVTAGRFKLTSCSASLKTSPQFRKATALGQPVEPVNILAPLGLNETLATPETHLHRVPFNQCLHELSGACQKKSVFQGDAAGDALHACRFSNVHVGFDRLRVLEVLEDRAVTSQHFRCHDALFDLPSGRVSPEAPEIGGQHSVVTAHREVRGVILKFVFYSERDVQKACSITGLILIEKKCRHLRQITLLTI